MIGKAQDSLQLLVERAKDDPTWIPFDLVVVDADKAGISDIYKHSLRLAVVKFAKCSSGNW